MGKRPLNLPVFLPSSPVPAPAPTLHLPKGLFEILSFHLAPKRTIPQISPETTGPQYRLGTAPEPASLLSDALTGA